jgi:hypothetical protein
MTKHHEEIANSTWFLLVGDKILLLALFIFFAPALWALRTFHSGQIVVGALAFATWAGVDAWALWELNRWNYLRLRISVLCTLLGLAAAILGIWSN